MSTKQVSNHAVRVHRRTLVTGETPAMVCRQLRAEGGPLIPAGTQHELEAALWSAMSGGFAGRPPVRRIGLSSRALHLEVAEDDIGTLLDRTLPVIRPGGVTGVPGLRPVPRRDHLDLRLIGSAGLVRLVGVNRGLWRAAVSRLKNERGADETLWSDCRDHLDDAERRVGDVPRPADLMSALVRRLVLLRSAAKVYGSPTSNSMSVYWKGGLRESTVAAILVESACRIPGAQVTPQQLLGEQRGIVVRRAETDYGRECPEPDWAWNEVEERRTPTTPTVRRTSASARHVSTDDLVIPIGKDEITVEDLDLIDDRPDGQWNRLFRPHRGEEITGCSS